MDFLEIEERAIATDYAAGRLPGDAAVAPRRLAAVGGPLARIACALVALPTCASAEPMGLGPLAELFSLPVIAAACTIATKYKPLPFRWMSSAKKS